MTRHPVSESHQAAALDAALGPEERSVSRIREALSSLESWLSDELTRLERESSEIDLLVQQTRVESERHESRRLKSEEQVRELER